VSVQTLFGSVGIGNAARGLCGGMVFAALDYWYAGLVPPTAQPAAGTPLFRFIVRQLVDSWQVSVGVARYYRWMVLSDGNARQSASNGRPSRPSWTPNTCPLGVVTVASANPMQLGVNHQVGACAYSVAGSEVTLGVYDPNSGPADDLWIRFSTAGASGFAHNLGLNRPVRGFFLTTYSPVQPPTG
jgi:hypothetical protein